MIQSNHNLSVSDRRKKVLELLERQERSTYWLAKRLGKNKQSTYNLLNGSRPHDDHVWTDIALVLGVPPSLLLDDSQELPPRETMETPRGRGVSIVKEDKVAMKFAVRAAIRSFRGVLAKFEGDQSVFEESEFVEVPTAFLIGGTSQIDQHACVFVSGRSLEPRIMSGDRVIIYCDPTLLRNTIVLAKSPAGDVVLKVLKEAAAGSGWELHSLNSQGESYKDLKDWQVLGHAICILNSDDGPGPNVEWRDGRPLRI